MFFERPGTLTPTLSLREREFLLSGTVGVEDCRVGAVEKRFLLPMGEG